VNAEHKLLIYRFLSGDLPLFACEQWLLSEDLPASLWPARQALNPPPEQRQVALEAALRELISPAQYQHWRLAQLLAWIRDEDPRACRALGICQGLWQQGLSFLAPLAQAYAEGQTPDGFDWNRVRERVPELKPIVHFLLQLLESAELSLTGEQSYLLETSQNQRLQQTPWRELAQTLPVATSEA